jgi:hypothetical protein
LKARRAFHLRACLGRIAADVLAAHRTGVFEFAHGAENISHLWLLGNALFSNTEAQVLDRAKCLCLPPALR